MRKSVFQPSLVFALACVVLPTAGRAADVVRREVGQVVLEDVPEVPAALRERMNQYLNVRTAALIDIDENGERLLISTRFGNTNQLHIVDGPGRARRQITFFDEPIRGGAFVPGSFGQKVLYSMDRGGTENNQIYLLNVADGVSTMLTDGKSKNDTLLISHSGNRIAFCSTARNGKDYDIYVGNAPAYKPRKVWEVSGMFQPSSFDEAGKRLIVEEYISEKVSHLHILDIESGKATPFTPKEDQFSYGNGVFSPDGRYVFFTSDRGGQFRQLFRREVKSGEDTVLTSDLPWDIDSIEVSKNSVAFTSNYGGQSRLYTMPIDDKKYVQYPGVQGATVTDLHFSGDGRRLAFTMTSPTLPGDVFVLNAAGKSSAPWSSADMVRWTESEAGGLAISRFVSPVIMDFPTFDTAKDGKPRAIPAYYYRPEGEGPFPVVIMIHGGPEAQERLRFVGFVQYLVSEMKLAVVIPNVRGSTGYGRDYHMLDDWDKREDSVKDIGSLLDWIEKQKELDSKRVAVYGGSYGGYMVLACLTNFPNRIKAGVDIVGIANFITFLEKTSPYRQDLRRAEYGDERDAKMRATFEKISPINNTDKMTAALYVQHGANDPRVPANEAEQIVKKLRDKGRTVWYMLAKDEGHGFAKKENRDLATLTATMFLEEQLKK